MEESRRSGLAGPSRVASFYEHLQSKSTEYRVLCTLCTFTYPAFFFFFLLLHLHLRLLFILNILINYTRMCMIMLGMGY